MKATKYIRRFIVIVLLLVLIVPTVAYVVLSTPWAQDRIRAVAETQLTQMLGAKVEIGRIDYKPFNTLAITSVDVRSDDGVKVAGIGKVAARFEFGYFIRTHKLLFDYAVVDVPEFNVWRDTPDSPLNIQPILDRFKKKDDQKPPASFDLKIGTIILRDGRLNYNVKSEPATPGRFNSHHIALSDLNLHAYLRNASNDGIDAMIESLSFREASGLTLSDLVVDLVVGPEGTAMRELEVTMPGSYLSLEPINLRAKGFSEIADSIRAHGINISTHGEAVVSTADFAPFLPVLGKLGLKAQGRFQVFVSAKNANGWLSVETENGITANMRARVDDLDEKGAEKYSVTIHQINAPAAALGQILENFSHKAAEMARRSGGLLLSAEANGEASHADAKALIQGAHGTIKADASAAFASGYKPESIEGNVQIEHIDAGDILALPQLGSVTATIDGRAAISRGAVSSAGTIDIISATWDGHAYKDLTAEGSYSPTHASAKIRSNDPAAKFFLEADLADEDGAKSLVAALTLDRFAPDELNMPMWREGFTAAGTLNASARGTNLNDLQGHIDLHDISLTDNTGRLDVKRFKAQLTRDGHSDILDIRSDFLNGSVEGEINPAGLPHIFKDMAAHIVPDLVAADDDVNAHLNEGDLHNRFTADLTLDHLAPVCQYLRLPVSVIYAVDILGFVDSRAGIASLSVDAPYLKQGDKIIDSTVVTAYIDTSTDRMTAYATTHMPTKKGPMAVVLGVSGAQNRFDTRIDWEIERDIPLNGMIDFSTALGRSDDGAVSVDTSFNPSQINFGEDVWTIHPSSLAWRDKSITVNNLRLTAGSQEIKIDGRGSQSPNDVINISLGNIVMISIFETLEIDNAMIGGTASGTFAASQVLSKIPVLTTDNLHVDSIAYNHCVIGTADVAAMWDNEKQSFFLDADIINPEGQLSEIKGDIFPAGERLDLTFDATHVRVGFMQKFMEAFASEVSGYGSGHAHLFGTFKDIDMEGDIYAEDLKLKIDFTNTVYSATDSVHITPGVIKLDDITLYDAYGHTAKINGILTHEYFHFPRFDFQITDARDFLCYDITEAMNPDWYGTIYGNGRASVTGRPGVIEIGAAMSTAPGSVFTFVLSDRLEAEQYSFITFNDVTELTAEEKFAEADIPADVREYIDRINAQNTDRPSDYNLDFRVDITPDAQMILVMDPVGGDRIRAYGSGDMRLTYNSTENDIRMYGTYTLDRGNYNFTLQDIIIKDFTIDPGSSITFRGDPYSAQLNIEAAYQLNANLTDLDESFALDKDLNRTNVPVQALLKVSGDMRQPDLDFDLRFPTLTSDTYRKVRSIISTDDMMNRQIIYLLALNRFYTPDYMESTTKGNELFSVASSTIASQLSNILGKLSDKWSIAPNLRSDRGDFSDIEVDVALSSRLLNNRLLLNGNLGYRDKSLNTNQFVGDFDIEYLLTPKGNWRLKGYSRYNDQNYYVRTAPTTQGVGIMFRRDFDTLIPRKKKESAPADTTALHAVPADTVAVDSVR